MKKYFALKGLFYLFMRTKLNIFSTGPDNKVFIKGTFEGQPEKRSFLLEKDHYNNNLHDFRRCFLLFRFNFYKITHY